MRDRDNSVFTSSTENESANKIRLPFTWEKSHAVFQQDDPNPTLQSTVTSHTLLKAGMWKRVIRSTTAALQGINIVIIRRMVQNYLVTSRIKSLLYLPNSTPKVVDFFVRLMKNVQIVIMFM